MSQELKDSGQRANFETGAIRDGAPLRGRFDLLPWETLVSFPEQCMHPAVLIRLAKHFEAGAEKYDARNWEKGIPVHVYFNSAFRHWLKIRANRTDEPHHAALAWNLVCVCWTIEQITYGKLPASLWQLPYKISELDWFDVCTSPFTDIYEVAMSICYSELINVFCDKNIQAFPHAAVNACIMLRSCNES